MTEKVISFPQDATRPPKRRRTIVDIMEAAEDMTPEQMAALVLLAYPEATAADIDRAYAQRAERRRAQNADYRAWSNIAALIAPVYSRDEVTNVTEALQVLTDQGNEAAAVFLTYINGPEAKEFTRVFRLAVDADPYWGVRPNGGTYCKPGAIYTTPPELVAAYRRNNNLE